MLRSWESFVVHPVSGAGWRTLLATLLFGLCIGAHAQSTSADVDPANVDAAAGDASDAGDPPSRVARLSYLAGDVGFLPAGEKDWASVTVNRPLTTGDRLSSSAGARAELQLDGGALRIAQNTDFGFLTLNDQMTQVELTQGTLNVAVRQLGEGESYEVDTPTVALVIDEPGTFRVDISSDGKSTRVTDFNGQAVVYGQDGAQRDIDQGSRYEFNDSALNHVAISALGGGDEFDNWAAERDQRVAQSVTRQYVSEEVVGASDLDQYGDWQSDPDYGQVWYPTQVDAGWAPYRAGHWAYVGPWGWTWVDDLPWGFAPYHYGRWICLRGHWGWIPGPIVRHPIYAPALVAFVGGVHAGRPVGWFPLGPGEVYNPWYRASRGYYSRVNFTNIRERGLERAALMDRINHHYDYFHRGQPFPNQHFVNRDAPHAFSAMSAQNFASARNVRQNLFNGDARQFGNTPIMNHGLGIRPTTASFAQARGPQARTLPAGGFNRQVVARTAPSASMLHQGPVSHAVMPGQPGQPGRPQFGNVRVLDGHGPTSGAPQSASHWYPGNLPPASRNAGTAPAGTQPPVPRGPAFNGQAPSNGTLPSQPQLRQGELPSSRFVHQPAANAPQPGERTGWRNRIEPENGNNMPRPGASFMTNAQEDRAREMNQGQSRNLPSPPQFYRGAPQQQEMPQQRQEPAFENRQVPQQRFERDDNRPRPSFEAPRPMPQQQPMPQRNFEPPQRGGGWQTPAPQQQHEQPHPGPQGRPEPRNEGRNEGRNTKDR
ncbi:DUF6600 domain-containing protein [Dyella sp.]|uniref:DUF6600 domain-containing protein n=1 Tax=Dyella sp. TaxID=1869338 RepID=UPI002ED598C6